jgi:hypothetical protein
MYGYMAFGLEEVVALGSGCYQYTDKDGDELTRGEAQRDDGSLGLGSPVLRR